MLKLLLAVAPYFINARDTSSQKQRAGSLPALLFYALCGITLITAIFVYVTSVYGFAIGFLAISGIFLSIGLFLSIKAKRQTAIKRNDAASASQTDPIAALVPSSVMQDPAVSKLVGQISANPLAASAIAVALGMIVTREFMKD